MSNSKVSIIIPAFNSQETIKETVLSCLNQSVPDIEVIVVDDGSEDNTLEVLKEIKDDRLILVKQANKGACAARNHGLSLATGDYIQYLDADDLLSPNKLENQLALLHGRKGVVASCSWGRFHNSISDFKLENSQLNKNFSKPIDWLIDSWNGKGMAACSAWLAPIELITKAGPWNEELKINQDGEFFSRVLLQAEEIVYCPQSRVYYRSSNSNSLSKASYSEAKALSLLNSYRLYVNHIPKNLQTMRVKKALARNFAEVIYRFENVYPNVGVEAWTELNKLQVKGFKPIGGKILQLLSTLVGFKRASQIRKKLLRR